MVLSVTKGVSGMEKFVKILKKLFPFTIILILVYFIPPVFILVDVYKRQFQSLSDRC